ncbi:homoserine dehydrogenase [Maricaulis sp.]|uniref:homoserine dehydrogenase n=1 Tax=Maricaulis sp. TaxID=1486257 RepID=UPI00263634AA|nr:homoserine dehydrogenase [Maricaulis sp.]
MNALSPQRSQHRICVLKFGSSVLRDHHDYARIAHEIYRHVREGEKVVAVVSALDGETDALFGLGEDVGAGAHDALLARLVRCGELKSAALLGLALERTGVACQVFDPHEMGLRAEGAPLDANLAGLDAAKVFAHLDQHDVIVAPGFFGEGDHGPSTLGRGGTDLTAVMFASWLGADRARLIKDVDGVYSDDPAKVANAKRFDQLDYAQAAQVSRGLVQEKAIHAAQSLGVVIEVAALGRAYATRIATVEARPGRVHEAEPLRVAVLGHGSVGQGVCAHLLAHPGRFQLNPVLVRDPGKHIQASPHPELRFTDDPLAALGERPDIVVETIGGTGLARALSQSVLREGAHLVSANKAVIAKDFELLHALASAGGQHLRYSAAVGGGAPVLEAIDRLGPNKDIGAIEGVMNGTCNFIFGQLDDGIALDDAIKEAQAKGFAEADPSTDIDGYDAADKLSILCWHAFGARVDVRDIERDTLRALAPERIAAAREDGLVFKQIGRADIAEDGQIRARVEIRALPQSHPFASLKNEANGFLIRRPRETGWVAGKGAGRWPTAEAVFADIMDIQRAVSGAGLEPSTIPSILAKSEAELMGDASA